MGLVGAAYHTPTGPQLWGYPLPGDHLWAQLCFLLGDAGAKGTAFAHPVGLQGPEARGQRCYLLQAVSLDLPSDADPKVTHQVTLLYFLPDTYHLRNPLSWPQPTSLCSCSYSFNKHLLRTYCVPGPIQGTKHIAGSDNNRSSLESLFHTRLCSIKSPHNPV